MVDDNLPKNTRASRGFEKRGFKLYKEDLLNEIEGLPSEEIKEVLDFICFIKARKRLIFLSLK